MLEAAGTVLMVVFIFILWFLVVVGVHADDAVHDVPLDPARIVLVDIRSCQLGVGVVVEMEVEIESDPRIEPNGSMIGGRSRRGGRCRQ